MPIKDFNCSKLNAATSTTGMSECASLAVRNVCRVFQSTKCLCADSQDTTGIGCSVAGTSITCQSLQPLGQKICESANGCTWETPTNGNAQCVETATSGSSPVEIALICALVICVLASVTAASIIIIRKCRPRPQEEQLLKESM